MACIRSLLNSVFHIPKTNFQVQQVRHICIEHRMLKDMKRRESVQQYGKERLRLNLLRKNTIIPPELKELAHDEIKKLPKSSSITALRNRCVVTSRSRGSVRNYRLSRIMFRHLADYNKLSGVQRSTW